MDCCLALFFCSLGLGPSYLDSFLLNYDAQCKPKFDIPQSLRRVEQERNKHDVVARKGERTGKGVLRRAMLLPGRLSAHNWTCGHAKITCEFEAHKFLDSSQVKEIFKIRNFPSSSSIICSLLEDDRAPCSFSLLPRSLERIVHTLNLSCPALSALFALLREKSTRLPSVCRLGRASQHSSLSQESI